MQIMRYLLILIVSILLVSCAESEELVPSKPVTVKNTLNSFQPPTDAVENIQKPDLNKLTGTHIAAPEVTDLAVSKVAAIDDNSVTQVAERVIAPTLPTGRLNGVFGTPDKLQAYISTGRNILKLKEGDQWEGWQVNSIAPDKLTISAGTNTHTLYLNQTIAPEASKQLALQNEYTKWSPPEGTSAGIKSPVHITQAQRETLQKRLLSIH